MVSRWILLRMVNISDNILEKKKQFCSISFRKSYPLWDNVEEYGTAKHAKEENTANALYMLDN
jgi:hypothetical protein